MCLGKGWRALPSAESTLHSALTPHSLPYVFLNHPQAQNLCFVSPGRYCKVDDQCSNRGIVR